MNVRAKTLDRLKQDALIADFYRDSLTGIDAITGTIFGATADFLAVNVFKDSGAADGVSVFWLHDLTRVRWNHLPARSVSILRNATGFAAPPTPLLQLSNVREAIASMYKAFGHVCLYAERLDSDICYIGTVAEIDDHHVVLNELKSLDRNGLASIMLPLDEITRLDAGGDYERDLEIVTKQALLGKP
ncbi:MAG: hypothetical protein ABL957_02420 [Parvularculaceae bacterium]